MLDFYCHLCLYLNWKPATRITYCTWPVGAANRQVVRMIRVLRVVRIARVSWEFSVVGGIGAVYTWHIFCQLMGPTLPVTACPWKVVVGKLVFFLGPGLFSRAELFVFWEGRFIPNLEKIILVDEYSFRCAETTTSFDKACIPSWCLVLSWTVVRSCWGILWIISSWGGISS